MNGLVSSTWPLKTSKVGLIPSAEFPAPGRYLERLFRVFALVSIKDKLIKLGYTTISDPHIPELICRPQRAQKGYVLREGAKVGR